MKTKRQKPGARLVVYQSDDEVLVTTTDLEEKMIIDWFADNTGRYQEHYKRHESRETAILIGPPAFNLRAIW